MLKADGLACPTGVFLAIRPFGNPLVNTMQVGREVLMVLGRLTFVGTYVVYAQVRGLSVGVVQVVACDKG
jgi:hypothetical protein